MPQRNNLWRFTTPRTELSSGSSFNFLMSTRNRKVLGNWRASENHPYRCLETCHHKFNSQNSGYLPCIDSLSAYLGTRVLHECTEWLGSHASYLQLLCRPNERHHCLLKYRSRSILFDFLRFNGSSDKSMTHVERTEMKSFKERKMENIFIFFFCLYKFNHLLVYEFYYIVEKIVLNNIALIPLISIQILKRRKYKIWSHTHFCYASL